MSKIFTFLVLAVLVISCNTNQNIKHVQTSQVIAQTPPMGWNSFDSYGVYLHEKAAMVNLEAFANKIAPYGYEYFVIDAGWYGEFKLQEGTNYPAERHAKKVNINEFGLLQPSNTYFPNGMKPIIDRCHEMGIKFGIHLMRGIPREAYRQNTPIKGSPYNAQDIADTSSICRWNDQNYGVDMSKPGAQEYYNSIINQMADWGVDYIKYDDLVGYSKEIDGIANAISQCGRTMVLSLSPGGLGRYLDPTSIDTLRRANMLRVTPDIWDDQFGIWVCFMAWRKWQGTEEPGFWVDMDMIPFGQLQLMTPMPKGVDGTETDEELEEKINKGELQIDELLAGVGWNRWSQFTKDQMYTFITQRSMAASPLMIGGDLPSMDDFSLQLLTNQDVISCNQNGIMGHLISEMNNIDVWKVNKKDSRDGWVGIFNRSDSIKTIDITKTEMALEEDKDYKLFDVWKGKDLEPENVINPNGVVFVRFTQL